MKLRVAILPLLIVASLLTIGVIDKTAPMPSVEREAQEKKADVKPEDRIALMKLTHPIDCPWVAKQSSGKWDKHYACSADLNRRYGSN